MLAARGGHHETVRVLLEKGADPRVLNHKREQAHMMAAADREDLNKLFQGHQSSWTWLKKLF